MMSSGDSVESWTDDNCTTGSKFERSNDFGFASSIFLMYGIDAVQLYSFCPLSMAEK